MTCLSHLCSPWSIACYAFLSTGKISPGRDHFLNYLYLKHTRFHPQDTVASITLASQNMTVVENVQANQCTQDGDVLVRELYTRYDLFTITE